MINQRDNSIGVAALATKSIDGLSHGANGSQLRAQSLSGQKDMLLGGGAASFSPKTRDGSSNVQRGGQPKIASLLSSGAPGLAQLQSLNGSSTLKDFAPQAGQLFQKMGNNIIQGGNCGGVYDMTSLMAQQKGNMGKMSSSAQLTSTCYIKQ